MRFTLLTAKIVDVNFFSLAVSETFCFEQYFKNSCIVWFLIQCVFSETWNIYGNTQYRIYLTFLPWFPWWDFISHIWSSVKLCVMLRNQIPECTDWLNKDFAIQRYFWEPSPFNFYFSNNLCDVVYPINYISRFFFCSYESSLIASHWIPHKSGSRRQKNCLQWQRPLTFGNRWIHLAKLLMHLVPLFCGEIFYFNTRTYASFIKASGASERLQSYFCFGVINSEAFDKVSYFV